MRLSWRKWFTWTALVAIALALGVVAIEVYLRAAIRDYVLQQHGEQQTSKLILCESTWQLKPCHEAIDHLWFVALGHDTVKTPFLDDPIFWLAARLQPVTYSDTEKRQSAQAAIELGSRFLALRGKQPINEIRVAYIAGMMSSLHLRDGRKEAAIEYLRHALAGLDQTRRSVDRVRWAEELQVKAILAEAEARNRS